VRVAIGRNGRVLSVAVAYAVLLVVLAVVRPGFFAVGNVQDLVINTVPVLLVALGMTLVILVREIDISVGAQFAVCGALAGWLAHAGVPLAAVPACVVAMGAALGAVNGVLVAFVGIPSIVVTLATMVIWREGLRWTTDGAWIDGLPVGWQWLGMGQAGAHLMTVGVATGCAAGLGWGLRHLAGGRALYAVGSDAEAARLAGIRPTRVVLGVFSATGALVGVAAVLNAIRFTAVPTTGGVGLEIAAIAAVVVGGTAITGGRGGVLGTVIGVALLGTIGPALTFLGLNAYWTLAVYGGVILAALGSDAAVRAMPQRAVPRR
jgi:rhamnose transport system permease protein